MKKSMKGSAEEGQDHSAYNPEELLNNTESILMNHDGTAWFSNVGSKIISEIYDEKKTTSSRKIDEDEVVLLKDSSVMGDGKNFYKFNIEGTRFTLTPYNPPPAVRESDPWKKLATEASENSAQPGSFSKAFEEMGFFTTRKN